MASILLKNRDFSNIHFKILPVPNKSLFRWVVLNIIRTKFWFFYFIICPNLRKEKKTSEEKSDLNIIFKKIQSLQFKPLGKIFLLKISKKMAPMVMAESATLKI